MIPGEIICAESDDLIANPGLETIVIAVSNTGDRPIQIGSHYHFYEANNALIFGRDSTLGFRLNIPAGTAVRFEPGDTREVELVSLAGKLEAWGHQGKVNGKIK